MTLQPQNELERAIARKTLEEVVRKLEEALRLQRGLPPETREETHA